MTRLLLVRHATGPHVGVRLVGRADGMHLSDAGRAECRALADDIAAWRPAFVYASPLVRTIETAVILAAPLNLPVQSLEGVAEMHVGAWTGARLATLDREASDDWRRFNAMRSITAPPNGELQLEVQARAVRTLLTLCHDHPHDTVLVVTHAEVIRATLGHFLGIPVDLQLRLDIQPASLSVVDVDPWRVTVHRINTVAQRASTRSHSGNEPRNPDPNAVDGV